MSGFFLLSWSIAAMSSSGIKAFDFTKTECKAPTTTQLSRTYYTVIPNLMQTCFDECGSTCKTIGLHYFFGYQNCYCNPTVGNHTDGVCTEVCPGESYFCGSGGFPIYFNIYNREETEEDTTTKADTSKTTQQQTTTDNGMLDSVIETSPCDQKDLKLPCGADRFVFTHTNGTETKDIQQSTYPHGTKVRIECHRNCPGQSIEDNNPTVERECRFGKWQHSFHKCMCNCFSSTVVKCQQRPMHRGWTTSASVTTEWRHYRNSAKCCYICSLQNRHNGGTTVAPDNPPPQCRSFNLRKAPYGVECQFFNEIDTKPTFDRQIYYFNLAV